MYEDFLNKVTENPSKWEKLSDSHEFLDFASIDENLYIFFCDKSEGYLLSVESFDAYLLDKDFWKILLEKSKENSHFEAYIDKAFAPDMMDKDRKIRVITCQI